MNVNLGEKKFNVPDNAIPPSGNWFNVDNCGNKWTQFPLKIIKDQYPFLKVVSRPNSSKKNKKKKN